MHKFICNLNLYNNLNEIIGAILHWILTNLDGVSLMKSETMQID